ncbi:MAG: ATPase, T2SS/T4P/T4SS family [Chlamydiota bacterium]
MPGKYTDIGEALVKEGLLSSLQLEEARRESARREQPLPRVLVDLKMTGEEELLSFTAKQLNVPLMNLEGYLVDPATLELVPEGLARKYLLIPLFKIEDTLTVAMEDPLDINALDELRFHIGCAIEPVLAADSDIRKAIDQHYGARGSMEEVVRHIEEDEPSLAAAKDGEIDLRMLQSIVEEAPVIKLVNLMIMEAIKARASDIHIEPEADMLRVRYRVDGVLNETYSPPKHLQPAIISRVKIMAGMDIAQKRIPQDGRIMVRMGNRDIDMRVSVQPTIHGENVVMRILDRGSVIVDLDALGFSVRDRAAFSELITRSYGMLLVTGPTGSGKTTTLYSAINMINTPDKNIMTVEEPVEYQMAMVRQTQVDRKVGVDFATALRTILRQDPNVILVGEIRDLETAEMAVRSALTGHLVFSTLHTNDAPSALTRLIDIGVEPFLVASSTIAVLAQRLVRTLCQACREPYAPSPKTLDGWKLDQKDVKKLFKPKGCEKCRDTGYSGRMGIFELMLIDEQIRDLIMGRAPSTKMREAAIRGGMKTLREDGLRLAIEGRTTLEEVARVAL